MFRPRSCPFLCECRAYSLEFLISYYDFGVIYTQGDIAYHPFPDVVPQDSISIIKQRFLPEIVAAAHAVPLETGADSFPPYTLIYQSGVTLSEIPLSLYIAALVYLRCFSEVVDLFQARLRHSNFRDDHTFADIAFASLFESNFEAFDAIHSRTSVNMLIRYLVFMAWRGDSDRMLHYYDTIDIALLPSMLWKLCVVAIQTDNKSLFLSLRERNPGFELNYFMNLISMIKSESHFLLDHFYEVIENALHGNSSQLTQQSRPLEYALDTCTRVIYLIDRKGFASNLVRFAQLLDRLNHSIPVSLV